jgi:hypothetical protein
MSNDNNGTGLTAWFAFVSGAHAAGNVILMGFAANGSLGRIGPGLIYFAILVSFVGLLCALTRFSDLSERSLGEVIFSTLIWLGLIAFNFVCLGNYASSV